MILYEERRNMKLSGFEALNRAKKEKRDKDLSLEQCKICKSRYKDIRGHIGRIHFLTLKEYREWRENT